jgi:AcrR family transcriptional regulator
MISKNLTKKDETRREIIKNTRDILSKMGYKKSSTEEIAKSLNKTKSALYHYFENREEIVKAVLHYEGDQLKNTLYEAISREDDPQKKLQIFFIIRAKQIYKLWNFYKSIIEEYFLRYSYIMMALDDYTRNEQAMVEGILKEGITRGVFRISDISLTSRTMIKMIKGFDFFMFQGEKFKEIQNELTEALHVFINGISKH